MKNKKFLPLVILVASLRCWASCCTPWEASTARCHIRLGPLFIGLMLANMPFKRATVVTIIGFGCSALVYPLFHLFSGLSNAMIAQIVSIAFSIAATAFILLNGKTAADCCR